MDTVNPSETGAKPLLALASGITRLQGLPMLPDNCLRTLNFIKQANATLSELATMVQRDPALTSDILRMANSPLYCIGRELSNVQQAIMRLGFNECHNLVTMVALRSLQKRVPARQMQRFETLWRHSFITACLARHLSEFLELGFKGEEFSSGLCHDIGRMLIAVCAPNLAAADPLDFIEDSQILLREAEIFGLDHCALGGLFAEMNTLPQSLDAVIRFHHADPGKTPSPLLVGLIALADDMANFVERNGNFGDYDRTQSRGWLYLVSVLKEPVIQTFHENIERVFVEAMSQAEAVLPVSA